MSLLLILAVVALILGVLFVAAALARAKQAGGGDAPWPFYAKRVLSPPEQVLYHRLVAALPEQIVLAQIQVSRVLGVKKGHNFMEWNNRINRLSYDFLVCGKDATVIAAIELDDKTHTKADRIETDQKKDKATSAAGVRLIRWNVKDLPDAATIRAQVLPELAAAPQVTAAEGPTQ